MVQKTSLVLCLFLALFIRGQAQTNVQVNSGEYFYDTDPGVGNGTAFTISPVADSVSKTLSITAPASLRPGRHNLYVRTSADSAGNYRRWSQVLGKPFYVQNRIVRAEYFFDTDPGTGMGTALSVGAVSDSISLSASITVPSLVAGRHRLYIRTQAADSLWSLAQVSDFFISPKLAAAEYFFDTDPGFGAGIPISIGALSDSINVSAAISVAGLVGGNHTLYVRTKDATGRWALTGRKAFFIFPKIVAAEYFWDTDPGVGNGTALSIVAGTDSITKSYAIHTPCLTPGMHYLYIRTKDDLGHWGLSGRDSIQYTLPSMNAAVTYPGPGPQGTPVKVLGSGGTAPYRYAYLPALPTADSIFLVPNNTAAMLVAIDTCGYSDTTTVTTPATPAAIASASTGAGSINFTGWRYWVYITDGTGNIIGAARDNGQDIGTVSMSYLRNSGTVRTFPYNGIPYLDRNFLVQAGALSSSIGVQLFALDAEYDALRLADPSITTKADLYLTKYNGPNEDLSITNNSYQGQQLAVDSVVTFLSAAGNGYSLAFSTATFSEFYESRNNNNVLPIRNIVLAATPKDGGVNNAWHTENEQSVATHTLLRLAEDGKWQALTTMPARNGVTNDYTFFDAHPHAGTNLYKVMARDISGAVYYSAVAKVYTGAGGTVTIYPNPARGYIYADGVQPGDIGILTDLSGRQLLSVTSAGATIEMKVTHLAAGSYLLKVQTASGSTRITQRVELIP